MVSERNSLIKLALQRYGNAIQRSNFDNLSFEELEALAEYGDHRAYYQQEYSFDSQFIEDNYGRVYQANAPLENEALRDFTNAQIAMRLGGRRMKQVYINTTVDDDYQLTFRKKTIRKLLHQLPPKFKVVRNRILADDINQLAEFCRDYYTISIKKILVAFLHHRCSELGMCVDINELVEGLSSEKKGIYHFLYEIRKAGLVDRDIREKSIESIQQSALNFVWKLKTMYDQITDDNISLIRSQVMSLDINNKLSKDKVLAILAINSVIPSLRIKDLCLDVCETKEEAIKLFQRTKSARERMNITPLVIDKPIESVESMVDGLMDTYDPSEYLEDLLNEQVDCILNMNLPYERDVLFDEIKEISKLSSTDVYIKREQICYNTATFSKNTSPSSPPDNSQVKVGLTIGHKGAIARTQLATITSLEKPPETIYWVGDINYYSDTFQQHLNSLRRSNHGLGQNWEEWLKKRLVRVIQQSPAYDSINELTTFFVRGQRFPQGSVLIIPDLIPLIERERRSPQLQRTCNEFADHLRRTMQNEFSQKRDSALQDTQNYYLQIQRENQSTHRRLSEDELDLMRLEYYESLMKNIQHWQRKREQANTECIDQFKRDKQELITVPPIKALQINERYEDCSYDPNVIGQLLNLLKAAEYYQARSGVQVYLGCAHPWVDDPRENGMIRSETDKLLIQFMQLHDRIQSSHEINRSICYARSNREQKHMLDCFRYDQQRWEVEVASVRGV
ncbi:MAG: hypothetical protein ACXAB7_01520 [Candidatus Kariarchaeaceae archaeon]